MLFNAVNDNDPSGSQFCALQEYPTAWRCSYRVDRSDFGRIDVKHDKPAPGMHWLMSGFSTTPSPPSTAVRMSNPERVATGFSGALKTDVESRTPAAMTQ